jgi:hypothetical protein
MAPGTIYTSCGYCGEVRVREEIAHGVVPFVQSRRILGLPAQCSRVPLVAELPSNTRAEEIFILRRQSWAKPLTALGEQIRLPKLSLPKFCFAGPFAEPHCSQGSRASSRLNIFVAFRKFGRAYLRPQLYAPVQSTRTIRARNNLGTTRLVSTPDTSILRTRRVSDELL